MTKRSLFCSLLLLVSTALWGQSTNLTATVTDSTGQTWNNGSYSIQFVPNPKIPGQGYQWNGAPFVPQNYTGVMDGTGTFTITLPDSLTITPAGSQWSFVLCPNATAQCSTVVTPVTGANENLSSFFSSRVIAPVIFAAPLPRAYSQSEVAPPPLSQGGQFFQVGVNVPFFWTGTNWKALGGADGVLLDPTTPQEICCFGLTVDKDFTAGSVNGIINANSFASLNAAVASCSGACTVEVNAPIGLSANLTIPSNVTLLFYQPGKVNLSGFTLSTATVIAGPYQIFSGGVTLGLQVKLPPVEWFGAVGDGSTDDTTAIQTCLNSLAAGQCTLLNRSYKLSGALSITRSNIGIRGVSMGFTSPTIYPTPLGSYLVQTSSGADVIDVAGTDPAHTITFNQFFDFGMRRTVAPTGTASGLSLNYTYGVWAIRLSSEDNINGFYVHASGSQGVGVIENSVATVGYRGVSGENGGTYYGWNIDSSDGNGSNSFRTRFSFFASNLGALATTTGYYVHGTNLNDQMVWNFETANATFGKQIIETSPGGVIAASDIHFWGCIDDGYFNTGTLIQGITTNGSGRIEINGGYAASLHSGVSGMHIQNSVGVDVANMQFGAFTNTYNNAIFVDSSSDVQVIGNRINADTIDGIVLGNSTGVTVVGNDINGNSASMGMIRLVNSSRNAVIGNTMTGTGNSLVADANSNANTGFDTNPIAAGAAVASVLGINPQGDTFPGAPTGLCPNGQTIGNSTNTAGTFPTYYCRNGVWVGQGTVY